MHTGRWLAATAATAAVVLGMTAQAAPAGSGAQGDAAAAAPVAAARNLVGQLSVPAAAAGWQTEAVVQGGTRLYQAARSADGTWTAAADVEAQAGSIGGVKASAVAGIDSDTHVLAIGGDGRLHHTIRRGDGGWAGFGDVNGVAGALGGLTRVSAVSIGRELHVVAVSNGRPFHTVRRGDGTWTGFGDVTGVAGPMGAITEVATASAGGQLQVTAISGWKAYHTLRSATGHWSAWGDVTAAAGATGPVESVAMAGVGNDAHLVIATENGTLQYHAIRRGDGSWQRFSGLEGVLGDVRVRSVGAGTVDGELQLAVTTWDDRVLHTVRHTDRTWSATVPVGLTGVTGTLGGISLAGVL